MEEQQMGVVVGVGVGVGVKVGVATVSLQLTSVMSSPEPPRRSFCFSAGGNSCSYAWGGQEVTEDDLQYLHVFDSGTETWNKRLLRGQHPPGVYNGACARIGQCLYMYGGEGLDGKVTGSLFELNLTTLLWRELSPGGPRTSHCGMVDYNETLIIYCNDLHMFDIGTGELVVIVCGEIETCHDVK